MKTRKVVVGAIAATMLSLSVCSLAPVFAAGETVQISVGKANVKAGEAFSVDVSLADIPSSGIQALDFAVTYDSSLITIDSVDAGALITGISQSGDASASLSKPFESYINSKEGYVSLIWTTAADDASYWIKGDGVFCTISGKAASGAKDGSVADLKIVPINRETYSGSGTSNSGIGCGYEKDGKPVQYSVTKNDGSVTIGTVATTTTTKQTPVVTMRGDANCDDSVDMAMLFLSCRASPTRTSMALKGSDSHHITSQGQANGDVVSDNGGKGGNGITSADASQIQKYLLGSISEL
uniref:Scaffoldin C n=1 Tax=Ruminococcus flavefaciens TaxID=1265 RepID=G9FEP6_RUMFL|nr:scaffoldin C [Ruminococcus flavefaciens]